MKGTITVVALLASFGLFFTSSTPLLFADQIGANDTANVTVSTETTYTSSNTVSVNIIAHSNGIPFNALYLQFGYIDSLVCNEPDINLRDFPFALEYSTSLDERILSLAVAAPGDGFIKDVRVASFTCHVVSAEMSTEASSFSLATTSHAYAADGFATELPLASLKN